MIIKEILFYPYEIGSKTDFPVSHSERTQCISFHSADRLLQNMMPDIQDLKKLNP